MYQYRDLWQQLLPLYEEREAQAIIRLLLETRYGLTMTDLCCGKLESMSAEDCQTLDTLMSRLLNGEPIQYVLEQADFMNRTFHVEPGVLIPRPETEKLCRYILRDHNHPYCGLQPPSPLQVLDIGTGSGCIAVTLALDLFIAEVTAWDISSEALLIARRNAHEWQARVNLEWQDALQAPDDHDRWDIIVSNPPYIAAHEKVDMAPHVLNHEPHTALFVSDEDPLLFYRVIGQYARQALKQDGNLYFEINPHYAQELKTMLTDQGFKHVLLIKDQFGKERFCKATQAF